MFVTWFSILSAISVASAVPVSLFPIRPYVILGSDLPKFALQPAVKIQSPASIQAVPLVKCVRNSTNVFDFKFNK